MSNYDKMCKRLIAYRNSLGLYQKDLGQLLGVTQEQYSYIENGVTKITDVHLRVFAQIGMDIDYLVVGETIKTEAKELDFISELFYDEENRNFALKLIAELTLKILSKADTHTFTKMDLNMLKLLEGYLEEWNDFSMISYVRLAMNSSQIDMAQLLGIGIKKYRAFEKEERFPDADLLIELYNMSGYPPSLFLDLYDRKLLVLKCVWKLLDADSRKRIFDLVDKISIIL